MKVINIIFILIGFVFSTSYSQNQTEFETELIKYHGLKDTLPRDNFWIYDKENNEIKKIKLDIYKNTSLQTYLVEMTWYLGYHSDDVNCIFTFDMNTKEIEFVGELWCNGFKESFYDNLLGYKITNKTDAKKFVLNFEKLLQANNPKVKFENMYYEENRTVFLQTNYDIASEKRLLWRIVVLNHPKGRLSGIQPINPKNIAQ